jgi:hypothetical protein
MDLAAPFKPEVLRPFVTIVVPGLIADAPYILLLGYYVPAVPKFWAEHPQVFAAICGAAVLATGFIISDLGELLEVHAWDRLLAKQDSKHNEKWQSYLKLQLDDELIAHRFLRTKVTQFKFELAMVPALVTFWVGLFWYQLLEPIWSPCGFLLFSLAVGAGVSYLTLESWKTANGLAKIRAYILDAIEKGPKGIMKP